MLPLIVTGSPTAKRRAAHAPRSTRSACFSARSQSRGALGRRAAAPVRRARVVNRPAILLADEPTASLDAAYADEIMEMFTAFNQVGVTVLLPRTIGN